MPGFDQDRFIDLSIREANHLSCNVCLNIFDNAVNSECGHSFCKGCVQQWIECQHKECPNCKTEFTKKRSNEMKTIENIVIIGDYEFRPNFTANGIISELKTKCEFDFNGCQQKGVFGSMAAHLKICEHRLCMSCSFEAGKPDNHNCVELLKKDRDELKSKFEILTKDWIELKNKFENSEKMLKDMNEYNENLEEQVHKLKKETKEWELKFNEAIEKNSNSSGKTESHNQKHIPWTRSMEIKYNSISIGVYMCGPGSCELSCSGILLSCIPVNGQENFKWIIAITFIEMQELLFCTDPSHQAVMVKPTTKLCKSIQQRLHLGNTSHNCKIFDVDSKDRKHWYISITFDKDLAEREGQTLFAYLSQKSKQFHRKIKSQALDWNQYKELIEDIHKRKG